MRLTYPFNNPHFCVSLLTWFCGASVCLTCPSPRRPWCWCGSGGGAVSCGTAAAVAAAAAAVVVVVVVSSPGRRGPRPLHPPGPHTGPHSGSSHLGHRYTGYRYRFALKGTVSPDLLMLVFFASNSFPFQVLWDGLVFFKI